MRRLVTTLAVATVLSPLAVFAQTTGTPTAATVITKEEIDTVNRTPGVDRQIRVVDIGHENFAVGIIHRGATTGPNAAPRPAPTAAATAAAAARPACGQIMTTPPPGQGTPGLITHDKQTEGYYVVSGGGTVITGGYLVNGRKSLSPDLNGPTCGGGMAYGDVKRTSVKAGDIIIIPAGVPHGWADITDHVDYLSFRPSPTILTAGWTNTAIQK